MLIILDDELNYFIILSCFFLVSSMPHLCKCKEFNKHLGHIFQACNLVWLVCMIKLLIKCKGVPRVGKSGLIDNIKLWGVGIYMGAEA